MAEEMWRHAVEERDNKDPKGDKVPLGDNRGATHGKLYLRRCFGLVNVSSLLVLSAQKRLPSYLLEGKY